MTQWYNIIGISQNRKSKRSPRCKMPRYQEVGGHSLLGFCHWSNRKLHEKIMINSSHNFIHLLTNFFFKKYYFCYNIHEFSLLSWTQAEGKTERISNVSVKTMIWMKFNWKLVRGQFMMAWVAMRFP